MNALRFLSSPIPTCQQWLSFKNTISRGASAASFLLAIMLLLLPLSSQAQSITCRGSVEIGFGPWCKVTLAPAQFISNPQDGPYTFEIVGTDISGPLDIEIDLEDIILNYGYNYRITNAGGTTCDHGMVTFRDYSPPLCLDIEPIVTTYCSAEDIKDAFADEVFSDCSGFTMNYSDVEEESCAYPLYEGKKVVKKITRSWTATDEYGNQTPVPCTQDIYVLSPEIEDIIVAPIVDIICDKNISIEDAIDPSNLPKLANPSIIVGGDTMEIRSACKYAVINSDSDPVPYEGNKVKIFRTWQITDWCTSETRFLQQTLKFIDDEAPVLNVVDSLTLEANIFSDDHHKLCEAIGQLATATATDNCSEDEDISIVIFIPHFGFSIPNGSVLPAGLPYGNNIVEYRATDQCGERSTKEVLVKVVDTTKPIALCTPFKNIGITNGASTSVAAEEFENASTDNCCIDRFEVRRADAANGDAAFDHHVEFYCEDDVVDVIFRVYDCAGNFNNCTLQVQVEDLIDPTIEAPEETSDDCTNVVGLDLTDIQVLQSRYGVPEVFDNCPDVGFVENTPVITETSCEGQQILRSFYARDAYGNISADTVNQLVQIIGISKFSVLFPASIEIDCAQEIPVTEPVLENMGCGDIFTRYQDVIYNQDEGACYKIVRTWEALDWCAFQINQTNDGSQVVDNHDVEGEPHIVMDGYIKFVQEIRVTDSEAPVIANAPDDIVVNLVDDCIGEAIVPAPIVTDNNCNGDATVLATIDGNPVVVGTAVSGSHGDIIVIKYIAVDGCNNYSDPVETSISFQDNKKPTPVCLNLSTELGEGGQVLIWANDFESGSSYDNCELNNTRLINKIIDVDGDNNFVEDVIDAPPAGQTSITFTCGDIGTQYVQYWIQDIAGNWEYCVTGIFITDADDDDCGNNATATVTGSIQTADGENIEQVEVIIDNPNMPSFFTGTDGIFNFFGLGMNQEYEVTPKKDVSDENGISTLDMVIMQRHILGVKELDSPYKILAADVNNSGSISISDMVELRKLILGIKSELTNTDSWKFVEANYVFGNPTDPFANNLPESVTVENDAEIEFIGYKMGDLNFNADVAGLLGGDDLIGEVAMWMEGQSFVNGEMVEVKLHAGEVISLLGLEMDINFDSQLLVFEGMTSETLSSLNAEMYHEKTDAVGSLKLAWSDAIGVDLLNDDEVITLQFRALQSASIEEALNINVYNESSVVTDEGTDLVEKGIDIQLILNVSEIKLFQNQPNPFSQETMIRFDLPVASPVALEVIDIAGKVIYNISSEFPQGENQIILTPDDLPASGIYYYRLSADQHVDTKKLIYIKN